MSEEPTLRERLALGLAKDFNRLFEFVNSLIQFFAGTDTKVLPLRVVSTANTSIDERIRKIDEARESLIDTLTAIDELKEAAEQNKSQLADALEKLKKLDNEKQAAEVELKEIRGLVTTDVDAFQKLAGIPDEDEKFRERILGFVSGVLSSLAVVGLLAAGSWLITKLSE